MSSHNAGIGVITTEYIIRNPGQDYLGDLRHYFGVTMTYARNLDHPYHNFRHVFHVLWLCFDACQFYKDDLSLRQRRNLLIAAMFHDFDHIGRTGNDDLNIELALRGLKKHIHPSDADHVEAIADIIRPTQFPYTCPSEKLFLEAQILRDADSSQGLSVAWIQQVIFGLGEEMGIGWRKVLEMQAGFLGNLKFITSWAEEMFPQSMIDAKVAEAKGLLSLL